jgi:hypothetical protein
MSGVAWRVDISGAGLTAVQRMVLEMQPERLLPVAGRAGVNCVRGHLLALNRNRPNRLGGPRTEYWRRAANATNYRPAGDGVILSINQIGMRLHADGGTVRPTKAKFLTIPVNPKAHGKRAREMDLELVYGAGGVPIALATKPTLSRSVTTTRTGRTVRRNTGRRGEIMFRLVRSVTLRADPTVLPTEDDLGGAVIAALQSSITRVLRSKGGGV